jgi:hypothetical protein
MISRRPGTAFFFGCCALQWRRWILQRVARVLACTAAGIAAKSALPLRRSRRQRLVILGRSRYSRYRIVWCLVALHLAPSRREKCFLIPNLSGRWISRKTHPNPANGRPSCRGSTAASGFARKSLRLEPAGEVRHAARDINAGRRRPRLGWQAVLPGIPAPVGR